MPNLSKELISKIIKSENQDLIEFYLSTTIASPIPLGIQISDSLPIDLDVGYSIIENSKSFFTKNLRKQFYSQVPTNT